MSQDYYRVMVCPKEQLFQYQNFIMARWKRSLRHGNPFFKLIDSQGLNDWYNFAIPLMIHKPETKVRLAVLGDDEDVALGFSVSRQNVLDFVHVDQRQRGLGIAQSLIPLGIDTVTHLTKEGKRLRDKHYPHWKFNPFL